MRRSYLLAFFALSACSASENLNGAHGGVARFHAELNAGQFDRIYKEAAPEWQQATSEPDTIKLFTAVHTKLGSFMSGSQTGWHVNYSTGGTTTVLAYASKFQKGVGRETFTFRSSGNQVQLMAYNIDSRALITG